MEVNDFGLMDYTFLIESLSKMLVDMVDEKIEMNWNLCGELKSLEKLKDLNFNSTKKQIMRRTSWLTKE